MVVPGGQGWNFESIKVDGIGLFCVKFQFKWNYPEEIICKKQYKQYMTIFLP